jgi:hypothetical protein
MTQPFTMQAPRPATFWQRLLGRRPPENAVIETNNLLARADSVRAVAPEHIDWICNTYGMDLRRDLAGRAERFYREYLLYCLQDHHLSEEEHADLQHLNLEDGRIDPGERAFLDRLQRALALPDRAAQRIEGVRLKREGDGYSASLR